MCIRWFFKWLETHRVVLLWEYVMKFQEDYDLPDSFDYLDDDDKEDLETYLACMNTVVEASKLFEGDQYPTASSIIPFLDQVNLKCKLKA